MEIPKVARAPIREARMTRFLPPGRLSQPLPKVRPVTREAETGNRKQAGTSLLPKEAQMDAKMALEKLTEIAEREIDRAFFEGQDFHRNCRRADEYAEAKG
jgi:hypothetical protein